jgi:hypothetical protein
MRNGQVASRVCEPMRVERPLPFRAPPLPHTPLTRVKARGTFSLLAQQRLHLPRVKGNHRERKTMLISSTLTNGDDVLERLLENDRQHS